jgi:4-hydroxy-3-methylbut-2-enyl diphosphate reductase
MVRHEIVHNRFVVDALKAKGAIFVEELDEVPDDVPVIFSAHGVPKTVPAKAEARGLNYLDATCPLVSKVHRQAERLVDAGRHILFIGHKGHPEVIGTFGQVPEGRISLIETAAEARSIMPANSAGLAYLTQTTLSVDDTAEMIAILRHRFPDIQGPRGEDICYATSNRQAAVKAITAECDAMLVIGAPNSSNSLRLVEVGTRDPARRRGRFQMARRGQGARHHRWRVGARGARPRAGRPSGDPLRDQRARGRERDRGHGIQAAAQPRGGLANPHRHHIRGR